MVNKLKQLVVQEEGQGMTEYGLVLGLIAVAAVSALALLRTEIVEMFDGVVDMVTNRDTGGTSTTTTP